MTLLPKFTFLYDGNYTVADLLRGRIGSPSQSIINIRCYAKDAAELLGLTPDFLEDLLMCNKPDWLSHAISRDIDEFCDPEGAIILCNCRPSDDFNALKFDRKDSLAICFGPLTGLNSFTTTMPRLWVPVQGPFDSVEYIVHELKISQQRSTTT